MEVKQKTLSNMDNIKNEEIKLNNEENYQKSIQSNEQSMNSPNQDESTIETDDKKQRKTNSTITSLSSEELLEIQSKDINEQTKILCKFFSKNKYPSKKELNILVKKTSKSLNSIETWFKNRRRSLANRGLMPDYMRKKIFKKNEVKILKKFFKLNPEASQYKMEQLAFRMNSTVKHIRNWFAYHKKKFDLEKDESLNEEEDEVLNFSKANGVKNIKQSVPLSSTQNSSMHCQSNPAYYPKIQSQNNINNGISIQNCYPSKANLYPFYSIQQNQNIMSPYLMNPQNQINQLNQMNQMNQMNQINQINQIQNNQNNYGVQYFQNKNGNDNQVYIITPISNQIPLNNYVLFQNPNQNQNQFIMPLMKTENISYLMVKNMNENSNKSMNLGNMQNMLSVSNESNQNYCRKNNADINNQNYYNGHTDGKMYSLINNESFNPHN